MRAETVVRLNKFKPRDYQLPIMDAIMNKGYKRVLAILPRRAGKDMTAWNIAIKECIRKTQVIYYIFPTFAQARRVIWDSITNDGMRVLDYIPPELIESKNGQQMSVRFINGSLLQLVGSDNYDALMGTNPQGCIFSEYALQDPRAYQYIRPILTVNNGWALFLSTPRGKNHLYEVYQIAKQAPGWFCYKLTVEDTKHVSLHELEKERAEGIMSEDLIQQEYYTSFDMGVEGSYYAKYMDRMRVNRQIGSVPWEPGFKVHTAWDIGVRDSTSIIFFQNVGQSIRIIDYYEKSKEGLEHYVNVINNKPYTYGRHIGPHDIRVTEFGSGITRIEKARNLGIKFTVADDVSVVDGIECVRSSLNKIWIDDKNCAQLIKSLENYRQEYDVKRKVYKSNPLHNWSSHACFVAETFILTRNGMRQIIDIKDNDEVLTLSGWQPCMKSILKIKNAKIAEVTFSDGTIVKCTLDHLFLTTNGWKSVKNLVKNTKILSSLTNLLSILMEDCIVYGLMRDILLGAEKAYIDQHGNQLLDQYQKIVTFITKTMIPVTTIYGILNVFKRATILNFLGLITRDLQFMLARRLPNGIVQMLEDYGIKDMLNVQNPGLNGPGLYENAYIVNQSLMDLYEEMDMSKNFVIRTAKHLTIAKVKLIEEKADVYDITVPNVGHFSLANGAIVHNSDAMRYLCVSLPKTRDGLTPEELDKRYQEAVLGTNMNMPAIFRTDLPDY